MLETVERMARVAHVPLSAQPNAGQPREVEGRNIYLSSPEYMASYARRFINNGVRLVGGCCGTTPDHVRHIKSAVRALAASVAKPAAPGRVKHSADSARRPSAAAVPVARAEKSRMANALARGLFTVAVELTPPRGHQAESLVEQARQLRIRGVDFVNIPDGPRASARMSALAASMVVQQQAGIETILHYACRDRNLLGMQSDLLGAHAMGIRNVLIDHRGSAARRRLSGCHRGLRRRLDRPHQRRRAAERRGRHRPAADRPADRVPHRRGGEPRRAGRGRRGPPLQVQGRGRRRVRDHPAGLRCRRVRGIPEAHRGPRACRSWPAIMPLESLRHAEYMANEVPGVRCPRPSSSGCGGRRTTGRAAAEGLAIASGDRGGRSSARAGDPDSTAAGAWIQRSTSSRPVAA